MGISLEDCEQMLRELVAAGGVTFDLGPCPVPTGSRDAVREPSPAGLSGPRVAEGWATVEGPAGGLRLDLKAVAKVALAEEEDPDAPVSYSARFLDASGQCLLRACFPSPYRDDQGRPTAFTAHRLALFEDFCRRYSGADGVEVRRLHRAYPGPERPQGPGPGQG